MNPPVPPAPTSGSGALPPSAYLRMALVLRVGLALALGILGAGLVAYLFLHGGEPSATVLTSNPILNYLNVPGLYEGLVTGRIEAYLTLGLIALVATPLARVASGFYYFRRGGERWMAAITLTVMILLLFGLLVLGPYIR
jgi:uncharacterized membrane protein